MNLNSAGMSIFKKKGSSGLPMISTASLPDIVFILLFFFMVTMVMRDETVLVRTNEPMAELTEKLENRSLVSYIRIGPPLDEMRGDQPMIQLGDDFGSVEQVGSFIEQERGLTAELLRNKRTTSLKVDQETRMALVSSVKHELREVYALKLMYSTLETTGE